MWNERMQRVVSEWTVGPIPSGVTAGRQIIRQGQEPTFVGLMVQGSASVVNLEGDVVAALGPGTIIGEIALFEGGREVCSHTTF